MTNIPPILDIKSLAELPRGGAFVPPFISDTREQGVEWARQYRPEVIYIFHRKSGKFMTWIRMYGSG